MVKTSGWQPSDESRHEIVLAVCFVVSYVFLDWVTYFQPVLQLGITPWNPHTGLMLTFLLRLGARWMPVAALAAFLAEIIVRDTPAAPLLLAASSLWIAGVYSAIAHLLGRDAPQEAIRLLSQTARFLMYAVLGGLLVAFGYIGLFVADGVLPLDSASDSLARYFVGDLNGMLMFVPLMSSAGQWRSAWQQVRQRWVEFVSQAIVIVLLVWWIFGLEVADRLRHFYPLFVPVIWIALRWGASGALLGTVAIQIAILVVNGTSTSTPFIELQFLMLTLCVTGFLLGAVVSERAEALARVAAREVELRAWLATAPDAVITVSPDGVPRNTNAVARRLFGILGEPHPNPPLSSLLPDFRLREREGRLAVTGARTDGTTFPAEIAWVKLEAPAQPGWLVIVRDSTEREQAQAQARESDRVLARAMRFAVAGELASALAHELNQPITALVSYLRASEILAAPLAREDHRLGETLGKAAGEAIRAARVLRRLRDFYQGGGRKRTSAVSIEECCAVVVRALEPRFQSEGIAFQTQIASDVPRIDSDDMQLEIVLHNMLANAIDAVSSRNPSERAVALRVGVFGDQVVLAVEDSGPGVSSDVLNTLFEPFNTSKTDGMGLGLAISRSLLRAQGGELAYSRSDTLGGACFRASVRVWQREEDLPQAVSS